MLEVEDVDNVACTVVDNMEAMPPPSSIQDLLVQRGWGEGGREEKSTRVTVLSAGSMRLWR